jgi:hypothetical protein
MRYVFNLFMIGLLWSCDGPSEQEPAKPDANLLRLIGTWEGKAPDNGPDLLESFSADGRHTMRMSSLVELTESGYFKLQGDTVLIWADGQTDTIAKKWMLEPGDSTLIMTYKTYVTRYRKVRHQ